MGNSLLDVIVFGRNAGKKAAAKCKNVELGEMNLDHIYKYADELDKADLHTDKVSPFQNMPVTSSADKRSDNQNIKVTVTSIR